MFSGGKVKGYNLENTVEILRIVIKCKLDLKKKNLYWKKNTKLYVHKFWKIHPPTNAWHNLSKL